MEGFENVDVAIVQPWQDHASSQVDDTGRRADVGFRLRRGADENDRAIAHRDGLGPGLRRIHGVDSAVRQHQTGRFDRSVQGR